MQQAVSKIRALSKKSNLYLSFGIPIIILSLIVACFIFAYINAKGDDEWSNDATLIAEVGVGVIITLSVVMFTRVHEDKIETQISSVLDIAKAREEIRKDKERQIRSWILSTLEKIQKEVTVVQDKIESYKNMKNRTDKNAINSQIVLICNKIKKVSKNELDDQRDLSLYFFDSDTLKIIKDISNGCKEKPEFDQRGKTVNMSSYAALKHKIDAEIAELNKKT